MKEIWDRGGGGAARSRIIRRRERKADLEKIGAVIMAEFKVCVMLVLSKLIKPQELHMPLFSCFCVGARKRARQRENVQTEGNNDGISLCC